MAKIADNLTYDDVMRVLGNKNGLLETMMPSMPFIASPSPHTHSFIPAPGAGNHTHAIPPNGALAQQVKKPYMPDKHELMRVLGIRLRVREGELFGPYIDFQVTPDKVYVFVVVDAGATIIEDDPSLFPSDALITAINLLKSSNSITP